MNVHRNNKLIKTVLLSALLLFYVQTFINSSKSYIPEIQAQDEFCVDRTRVHGRSTTYVYT